MTEEMYPELKNILDEEGRIDDLKMESLKQTFETLTNNTKQQSINLSEVLGVEVDQESEEELRKGNLVKFMQNRPDIVGAAMPADECFTEDDEEGECLTVAECSAAGGTSVGQCHQGMDYAPYPRTCCVYSYECDASTNKDVFYYKSPNYPKPPKSKAKCSLEVEVKPGVCQLRLDFIHFKMGKMSSSGQCPEGDSLKVETSVRNSQLPVKQLCGTLTSHQTSDPHLYLHIGEDDSNKTRTVTLDSSITNFRNTWNIQVTQITCNGAPLQAPSGCAQYYMDRKGSISSLNFPDGQYLPNLDLTTCIRPDETACGIRFNLTTLYVGGNTASSGKLMYGLTCSDYLAFLGEITGICGYATNLDVTLPLFGYQGFTFRSDAETKKYEAGFMMNYKYIHSCSEEKFYKYPSHAVNK